MATYNYYGSYTIGANAKSGRSQLQVVTSETATTFTITLRGIADRKSGYTLKYGYKSWLYIGGSQVAYKAESSASNSYPRTLTTYSKTYNKTTSPQTISVSHKLSSQWTSTTYTSTASGTITIPALASYAVTYNANGGTGAPGNQTKYYGKNITLSTVVPSRTNYRFLGWGTSADATSPSYQPGGTYTGNAALSLFAIWVLDANIATFNADGGICDPSSVAVTIGSDLLQADCPSTATKIGYTFVDWEDPDGNSISTYYNLPLSSDVTFTAKYTPSTYTIYVEANGGSGDTSFSADYGDTVTSADFTAPTRAHYTLSEYEVYAGADSSADYVKSFSADDFSEVMDWVLSSGQSAATLKSIWNAYDHTVSFLDPLFGYNVSGNDTILEYGTVLTSSDFNDILRPSRVGYTCIGWSTTPYGLGVGTALSTLTITADTTLYAVWEFIPTYPAIVQSQSHAEWFLDSGTSKVKLTVNSTRGRDKTSAEVTANTLVISYDDDQGGTTIVTVSNVGTTYTTILANVDEDATQITVIIYETAVPGETNSYDIPLRKPYYPIDILPGGKSIAFGGAAEDDLTGHPSGLFECFMDTKFTDMTAQEVQDFVDGLDFQRQTISFETKELLWTNPNPTGAFPAQTIQCDTDYDSYEIVYTGYTGQPDVKKTERLDESQGILSFITGSSGQVSGLFYFFKRQVWKGASGVGFGDIYASYATSTSWARYTANTGIVPYKIYGINLIEL